MTTLLVTLMLLFMGYALYTQYNKTPVDESIPKRVWASIVAAAGVLGALVTNLFHSGAGQ